MATSASGKTQTEAEVKTRDGGKVEVERSTERRMGPEGERQRTASTLKEALYGNRDAEQAAADEMTEAQQEAYREAAQAELDAQQKDRDEGYATDATEGPAKVKVIEDDDDQKEDAPR